MSLLKRDNLDLFLGVGVLAVGLILLLFTFSQAFALVQNPGNFIRGQVPSAQQGQAPVASFNWNSNGLTLNVQDASQSGSGQIVSWHWDFGDGQQVSGQNPGTHTYASAGAWNVSLVIRDDNNRESRAFADVYVSAGVQRSGVSFGDAASQLNVNVDLGSALLPLAVVLLTVGLFLAMAVMGGMITKAGWNLIKPKPETIRVRLKPKDLTQAFEADETAAGVPPQVPVVQPPVPPPPGP